MPIVFPFELFAVVEFLWDDFWKFEGIKGEFEIFAIWIVEENPPKTKIWANNSPSTNPVKFEQVKENEVTEVIWQLGFDEVDENESISSIFLFFFFETEVEGIIDNWM